MAGLSFKCPKCGEKMTIRTSAYITEMTRQALLYCLPCGIKGKLTAELHDVQQANYSPENSTQKAD